MNHKLSAEYHSFTFSKANSPVLNVNSGDTVEIDTLDCFSNQLQTPEDSLEKMDWERVNPATGPIYIKEANCGDVLKVTIENITLSSQGVMAAGKDLGPLGGFLDGIHSKLMPIKDNVAIFDNNLELPLNPMVGVIGVAPSSSSINTGTPGPHGGNMDNAMITTGAVLYLPIFVDGALFSLGDLHAAMGDGEIGETGIEIKGIVKVKLEIIKDLKLNNPVLINDNLFTTIASANTLDEAVETCSVDMYKLLIERLSLDKFDLVMLMSAAGNSEICQVVDPLKTARFVMPIWVLEKYNFQF